MNPLADNPLKTRSDLQQAVIQLFEPLKPYFSPGKARLKPGVTGAHFSDTAAELEGFSRPLWGIIPLAAGNGKFDDWPLYRSGLENGSNPDSPEYWGVTNETSQKHVEMAAIGFALALVPEEVWEPLDDATQETSPIG